MNSHDKDQRVALREALMSGVAKPKTREEAEISASKKRQMDYNRVKAKYPRYRDPEYVGSRLQELRWKAKEYGWKDARVLAGGADEIFYLEEMDSREKREQDLDNIVESGKRQGRNPEKLVSDLVQYDGAHLHRSGSVS
jgi:hypothetical protein